MPIARLREERKKRRLSQARLARILHVHQTTVSHYETCFSQPRPASAAALEGIFGIPADELLSAAADPHQSSRPPLGASKEDHDALQRD